MISWNVHGTPSGEMSFVGVQHNPVITDYSPASFISRCTWFAERVFDFFLPSEKTIKAHAEKNLDFVD